MKFQRFIDGAVASDGGTISCRALLDEGKVLQCGLHARIPMTRSERLIFAGPGVPAHWLRGFFSATVPRNKSLSLRFRSSSVASRTK